MLSSKLGSTAAADAHHDHDHDESDPETHYSSSAVISANAGRSLLIPKSSSESAVAGAHTGVPTRLGLVLTESGTGGIISAPESLHSPVSTGSTASYASTAARAGARSPYPSCASPAAAPWAAATATASAASLLRYGSTQHSTTGVVLPSAPASIGARLTLIWAHVACHAPKELLVMKKNYRIFVLGAFFQYVHAVAHNLAYFLHIPKQPLYDLGFAVLPAMPTPVQIVSEIAFFIIVVSTVLFALAPFFHDNIEAVQHSLLLTATAKPVPAVSSAAGGVASRRSPWQSGPGRRYNSARSSAAGLSTGHAASHRLPSSASAGGAGSPAEDAGSTSECRGRGGVRCAAPAGSPLQSAAAAAAGASVTPALLSPATSYTGTDTASAGASANGSAGPRASSVVTVGASPTTATAAAAAAAASVVSPGSRNRVMAALLAESAATAAARGSGVAATGVAWAGAHPPIYTVLALGRFFAVLVLAQAIRITCFLVTALPGPNYHCHPFSPHYDPPTTAWDILFRSDAFFSCGDLVFSSHTTFIVLCALAYQKYGRIPWLKKAFWATVLFFGGLVISAHKHYSLDIVVALYTVPLLWYAYDIYCPDLMPEELVGWEVKQAQALNPRLADVMG